MITSVPTIGGCRMSTRETGVRCLHHGAFRDRPAGEMRRPDASADGAPVHPCLSAAAGDVEIDL